MLRHGPALALITAALLAPPAGALERLSDEELGSRTAREGVLLNLRLLNNMTGSTTVAPDSQCTASVRPNPCRMGLEIAQAGTWFMAKEFFGSLQLKDLRMDAGFLPATATGYQNYDRFKDASGNCLLSGNPAGCNPAGLAAVLARYPSSPDNSPAVYDDVLSLMNIGRTWLEFTTGTSPVIEGYMRDTTTNSVFGVRLSDSRTLNEPGHLRFRGTAYVNGF